MIEWQRVAIFTNIAIVACPLIAVGGAVVTITSAEAQNKFGQLLDTAQREPVSITRHGRTAAFLVSQQDMEELMDARKERSRAVAALEEWRAEARKETRPAAGSLSDDEVVQLVHKLR